MVTLCGTASSPQPLKLQGVSANRLAKGISPWPSGGGASSIGSTATGRSTATSECSLVALAAVGYLILLFTYLQECVQSVREGITKWNEWRSFDIIGLCPVKSSTALMADPEKKKNDTTGNSRKKARQKQYEADKTNSQFHNSSPYFLRPFTKGCRFEMNKIHIEKPPKQTKPHSRQQRGPCGQSSGSSLCFYPEQTQRQFWHKCLEPRSSPLSRCLVVLWTHIVVFGGPVRVPQCVETSFFFCLFVVSVLLVFG